MSEVRQNSTDTNLAQLFMRAFYWADEGLQNALKKGGWPSITRAQSLVFVNIAEGVTRPSEIAARVGVTRQAIQREGFPMGRGLPCWAQHRITGLKLLRL